MLAALFGGGWYLLNEPDTDQLPTYSESKVRRDTISAVVSATGTLNPINTVLVGSQVSGTIQRLYADFNDQVKQGQLIAQIDPAVGNHIPPNTPVENALYYNQVYEELCWR